jgi:hypothetical protein
MIYSIDEVASREEVLKNIQDSLALARERKMVYQIVGQVLETYEGKKITKSIDKVLERALPGYLISYFKDEPYYKKVTIRRRHGGNKEVFSETMLLHSEHYGENFSIARYLDGEHHVSHLIGQIMEYQALIENFDAAYETMIAGMDEFITAHQKFTATMKPLTSFWHHLNDDAKDYIIRTT